MSAAGEGMDSLVRVTLVLRERSLQCRSGGEHQRILAGRRSELD
jgi:hypothetical protein